MKQEINDGETTKVVQDRREFLSKCGRFAAVTPPAITLLLSTSLGSDAIARSGGEGGGGGGGRETAGSRGGGREGGEGGGGRGGREGRG